MLVILSGVAGAGKDTIRKELTKKIEEATSIPSYTTREPRADDIPGETYHFISKLEFEKKIEEGEFYEYDVHHGNYYGTSKKVLNEKAKSGLVIKDIDVNGTQVLKDTLTDIKVVTIFLRVPKEELQNRLENRIDKLPRDEIILRLNRFDYEESKISNYDYVLKNDHLEKTVAIIEKIIEYERKIEKF